MELYIIAFIAGILTVLTPCVLPVLPVVIGNTLTENSARRAVVIIGSLSLAILLFTFLLKASTILINIDPQVWKNISGGLILLFGLITLFPDAWERVNTRLGLSRGSSKLLNSSARKKGMWGEVLIGMSLGPVFSSCSPTYSIILATILPQSFGQGLILLVLYCLGLATILLLIALLGQRAVSRLRWAADPKGWFRKLLGIILVIVGMAIVTGYDKRLETAILNNPSFNLTNIELKIIENSGMRD